MQKSCTLCGCTYDELYTFKAGHVCENCVKDLKSDFSPDIKVRANGKY